jgi:hypothetical protein
VRRKERHEGYVSDADDRTNRPLTLGAVAIEMRDIWDFIYSYQFFLDNALMGAVFGT